MSNCRNKKSGYKKGFGLLEVLLAGVIIVVILSALVVIGRAATNNAEYSLERAQAIYLAQEGIETIRQMRDTNWIDRDSATEWDALDFHSDAFSSVNSGCYQIARITSSTNLLYIGRFGLSNQNINPKSACIDTSSMSHWEKINYNGTDFYRVIYLDNVGNLIPGDGITTHDVLSASSFRATVYIQWQKQGTWLGTPIEVSEVVTNWRPNY